MTKNYAIIDNSTGTFMTGKFSDSFASTYNFLVENVYKFEGHQISVMDMHNPIDCMTIYDNGVLAEVKQRLGLAQ